MSLENAGHGLNDCLIGATYLGREEFVILNIEGEDEEVERSGEVFAKEDCLIFLDSTDPHGQIYMMECFINPLKPTESQMDSIMTHHFGANWKKETAYKPTDVLFSNYVGKSVHYTKFRKEEVFEFNEYDGFVFSKLVNRGETLKSYEFTRVQVEKMCKKFLNIS